MKLILPYCVCQGIQECSKISGTFSGIYISSFSTQYSRINVTGPYPVLSLFSYLGYFWSWWIWERPTQHSSSHRKIHVLPLPLSVDLIGVTLNFKIMRNCARKNSNYIEHHQSILSFLRYLHVYEFIWLNLLMCRCDTFIRALCKLSVPQHTSVPLRWNRCANPTGTTPVHVLCDPTKSWNFCKVSLQRYNGQFWSVPFHT